MRDGETHLLHLRDNRRGRCGAAGGDLHVCGNPPPHRRRRMDQHRQHDRRAAHMGNVMVSDRGENRCGIDTAQANMGAPASVTAQV